MDNEIRRATGLLVIEVVNSNPNGDPDRESDPRQRPNGCGEISPVSFKRKLRDLLDDHDTPFFRSLPEKFRADADRYCILEHRGRDRKQITAEMGNEPEKFLQSEFVRKYWDARVFGNTFLEDGGNKGLSRPASCSSAWGFPSHRSTFSARRIQMKQACRREKTQAWRRWPIGLWSMASTVCRFS